VPINPPPDQLAAKSGDFSAPTFGENSRPVDSIDIGKFKFDVCLDTAPGIRHAVFDNSEAGFAQLRVWLDKWRPDPTIPLHVALEATGNWGLDVAAFLVAARHTVSIINPARIKAYAQSELARNKTDRLDAGVIARFCRSQSPPPWQPPPAYRRELRDLVRRCDALKVMRVQELNRRLSGCASAEVAASIDAMLAMITRQIAAIEASVRRLIDDSAVLRTNFVLLRSIHGIGEVTAALLLAELPNIEEFSPKALAAFIGLSPQEHSSGTRSRRSQTISRIGSERVRSALFMAALSAKRHNPALQDFVSRMTAAGKAPKVVLIAVARKLAVYAQAVVRTQTAFQANHAHNAA
jgi:transposase